MTWVGERFLHRLFVDQHLHLRPSLALVRHLESAR